jgi:hypothetical protein
VRPAPFPVRRPERYRDSFFQQTGDVTVGVQRQSASSPMGCPECFDGSELDVELFYCGSLLHDHGIAPPTPGRDFTLGSAERTLACATTAGVSDDRAQALADAICVHTTPGVSIDRDGALGCYLQWGAMVDGAGLRIWDVAPANVTEILRRYPREDFKRQLVAMMRAEAAAVPGGRFGLLVRCGLPLAVRMAPFKT